MIRFHCLECGMLIQAPDSAVGRAAKCPGCGAVLEIPQNSSPVPPPPPKVAAVAPPVAPPPPPEVAATGGGDSLSLDELLGSAATTASVANPFADSRGGTMTEPGIAGGRTRSGGAVKKKGGTRSAPATKRAKNGVKSAASPETKIRNLSIAAIAAGAIGLALFAVPYAGAVLGVVGAAVGFYALSMASARRNAPMGLALAGAAVGVVAAGLGGYSTYRGMAPPSVATNAQPPAANTAADSTGDDDASDASFALEASRFAGAAVKAAAASAVAEARNPLTFAMAAVQGAAADHAQSAKRLAAAARPAGPVTLRIQDPTQAAQKTAIAATTTGVESTTPTGDGATAPAAPAPIHWAAADQGEAQGSDDVKVTLTKAVTGTVFFHNGGNALLDGHETSMSYLHISLKIQNNQLAGSIDYKSWMTLPSSAMTLTDDKGNEIERFEISKEFLAAQQQNVTLDEVHPARQIDTSQSAEDTLIFHLPPEGSGNLRLTLSGKAVGLADDLHFQIPRSMVHAAETGNPLLPLTAP